MGATVSRDAETHAHVALTASELALAWRNGAPFAQLHDELYVSEKFHELVRRRGIMTRASAFGDEDGERVEATGGDVLSRDELLHVLDVFRLRMLGQTAERRVGSATTPSVRASKAIVSNERLREERIQLVRTYFEDFAALVSRQAQSEVKKIDATKPKSGDRIVPGPSFIGSDGGLVAGSMFSIGSFRLQLEMLRTFRVMAPELFSNGLWAIVKTVLAFPDFALLGVENDSMDDLFLRDVFEFVLAQLKEEGLLSVHRDILLLALLVFGSSSGGSIHGRPFHEWVEDVLVRLEKYRVDFGLGTLQDKALQHQVLITNIRDEAAERSVETATSITTDGSYVYKWDTTNGLVKVGTGKNFTVAGKVYAHVLLEIYLQLLRSETTLKKVFYGEATDITARVRELLAVNGAEGASRTVREALVAQAVSSAIRGRDLYIEFSVDGTTRVVNICPDDLLSSLGDTVSKLRENSVEFSLGLALNGDFVALGDPALTKLQSLIDQKPVAEENKKDNCLAVHLMNDLISHCEPGVISESKRVHLVLGNRWSSSTYVKKVAVGDSLSMTEGLAEGVYHSSIAYCGDSVYLSLLTHGSGLAPTMEYGLSGITRKLLQINPSDLTSVGWLLLKSEQAELSCSLSQPLLTYISDGLRLLEVEMTAEHFYVRSFKLNEANSTARFVRAIKASTKHIESPPFISFLERLRSNDGEMRASEVLTLFTNGSVLDMMLPTDFSKAKSVDAEYQCLMLDC